MPSIQTFNSHSNCLISSMQTRLSLINSRDLRVRKLVHLLAVQTVVIPAFFYSIARWIKGCFGALGILIWHRGNHTRTYEQLLLTGTQNIAHLPTVRYLPYLFWSGQNVTTAHASADEPLIDRWNNSLISSLPHFTNSWNCSLCLTWCALSENTSADYRFVLANGPTTLAVLSTPGRRRPLHDDFVSSTLGCHPRNLCALTNIWPWAQSKSTSRLNCTYGLSNWSFFRATSRLTACSHWIGAYHT